MQHPQILVYESDGILAGHLQELARERKWPLREPRQSDSFAALLQRGDPTVFVLKLGRNLTAEFELLDRVQCTYPQTATVVVGDHADAALAGLAWDLGASYVLFPPQPRKRLTDVVVALMRGLTAEAKDT